MILAHHVIFTAYGFWLPNDPRGSWSNFVRNWELVRFGKATKIETRASVAHHPHDRTKRIAAKEALAHPPVIFDGHQALAIAEGFSIAIQKTGATVLACSILPAHVHLVFARHQYNVEYLVGLFKGEATKALIRRNMHPMPCMPSAKSLSPWARKCWKVFIDNHAQLSNAIRYVEENPVMEHKRPQHWSFITSSSVTKPIIPAASEYTSTRRPLGDR